MILDPDRNGCRIWHDNATAYINGNVRDICNEIYKRCTIVINNDEHVLPIVKQAVDISVYIYDNGIAYRDTLTKMGLFVKYIKPKILNDLMPITNVESVSMTKYLNEKEMNYKNIKKDSTEINKPKRDPITGELSLLMRACLY